MEKKIILGIMVTLILFSGLTVSLAIANPIPFPPGSPVPESWIVSVVMAESFAFFVGIFVLSLFGMGDKKAVLVSAIVVLASLIAGVTIWVLTGLFPPPSSSTSEHWIVSVFVAEFCGFLVGWIILTLFKMEKKNAISASTIILLASLTTSVAIWWFAGLFP